MQSAVTSLRVRHRSSTVLKGLVKLADPALLVPSCAHNVQAGRSLTFDQRFPPNSTEEDVRIRFVYGDSAKPICHIPSSKSYSSSAEFSGGSFNVSATPSDSRQDKEAADDVDDRIMLLEASLSFVVSSLCSWLASSAVCCVVAEVKATFLMFCIYFRVTKDGQMQP